MPDMSEFHETEEEMEDRCDAQRDSEKDAFPVEPIEPIEPVHPFTAMLERLRAIAGRKPPSKDVFFGRGIVNWRRK